VNVLVAVTLTLVLLLTSVPTRAEPRASRGTIERGEYLVNLLACGRCHTEGYLTGQTATAPLLAGSLIGIAWHSPADAEDLPGLVFASNLTPDPDTGIGNWSRADLVRAMRTGVSKDGHQHLPVMPWANYATLTDRDLDAIAAYLQRLPPVRRAIPARTEPGTPARHSYVRFGVYLFEPSGAMRERAVP
jgi:cytochrome c553